MAEGVRKSLSPEEHSLRTQFDAMQKDDARRGSVWSKLQEARSGGARQKERFYVKVRLQEESPARVASCLIADLKIVEPEEARPSGGPNPTRIDAYAPCELLFDTELPPCDRQGACPHDVVVYVMESDNGKSTGRERAWDALRQLAGRQPNAR